MCRRDHARRRRVCRLTSWRRNAVRDIPLLCVNRYICRYAHTWSRSMKLNHARFASALIRATAAFGVATALLIPARGAIAQDTASTREDVLRSQMMDAASVRARIRQSGLTPQQVRDRLQARGM